MEKKMWAELQELLKIMMEVLISVIRIMREKLMVKKSVLVELQGIKMQIEAFNIVTMLEK